MGLGVGPANADDIARDDDKLEDAAAAAAAAAAEFIGIDDDEEVPSLPPTVSTPPTFQCDNAVSEEEGAGISGADLEALTGEAPPRKSESTPDFIVADVDVVSRRASPAEATRVTDGLLPPRLLLARFRDLLDAPWRTTRKRRSYSVCVSDINIVVIMRRRRRRHHASVAL